MTKAILRLPAVRALTGMSRSWIYDSVKKGTFPAPVALSARAVGWTEAAIAEWIDQRPLAACAPHAARIRHRGV